jgi:hypothetical protein
MSMTSKVSLGRHLSGQVLRCLELNDRSRTFEAWVKLWHQDRWLMFSDYVLERRNDSQNVLAFSIIPAGRYWRHIFARVSGTALLDFKDTQVISQEMIGLLLDSQIFTFCFLLPKNGLLLSNREGMLPALEGLVEWMQPYRSDPEHQSTYQRLAAVRRKASSKGFNLLLFKQLLVTSTLAATIGWLICRTLRIDRLGWFSDRDKMTLAHQEFYRDIFEVTISELCAEDPGGWTGPKLGVNDFSGNAQAEGLWCDNFLRIPDHFAGVLAALDIHGNKLHSDKTKYKQMLRDVIAHAQNLQVIELRASGSGSAYGIDTISFNFGPRM